MKERESFGSRLGFILVSAGCAVGLGNVWKFPYMCGQYGGALFILIYLVFLAILGFPIMTCEFAVGRGSRKSCASSFHVLEPTGTNWHKFAYMGMAGNLLLLMFYSMVAGWMLYYFYRSVNGSLTEAALTAEQAGMQFGAMTSSASTLCIWTIIALTLSVGICSAGLEKGVEKVTKIMMISLLALIVVMAVHSVTLPGAMEGVKFYLIPDMDVMRSHGLGKILFGAMSQAFFTLSIGMGGQAIFGSYMSKDHTLTGETISIILIDTFVALFAGLVIIPACFAFDIKPDAGPPLIFITLPTLFGKMAGGRIWSSLFFLFLSFASLSTVIGVLENIIAFGMDLWGWSRRKAANISAASLVVLSLPCILGFNVLSGINPLGPGSNIMDLEDFLVSNNILPLGSVVYLMFCTCSYGWGWDSFITEAEQGEGLRFPKGIRGYMTYILPLIVIFVYLKGYWDTFSEKGTFFLVSWMIIAAAFLGLIGYFTIGSRRNGNQ